MNHFIFIDINETLLIYLNEEFVSNGVLELANAFHLLL